MILSHQEIHQVISQATLLGIRPDIFRATLPMGIISNEQVDYMVELVAVSHNIQLAELELHVNGGMDGKEEDGYLLREARRA